MFPSLLTTEEEWD